MLPSMVSRYGEVHQEDGSKQKGQRVHNKRSVRAPNGNDDASEHGPNAQRSGP